VGPAWLVSPQTTVRAQTWTVVWPKPPFVVRSHGGKCLDFGPPPQINGAPVFIRTCDGSTAQQVHIEEVNAQRDVILRAGTKVIGVKSDLVMTPGASPGAAPLELQPEVDRNRGIATNQVFALDGDSIILASDRRRVVKVQNARGANQTPLVLGPRDLADAELWTFAASDGSSWRPTSGFVRISQDHDRPGGEAVARLAFIDAIRNATWGTVIELDGDVALDLTDVEPLYIPAGVTIRGDRRGTRPGPLLKALDAQLSLSEHFPNSDVGMLFIYGDHVRITGLRLQGPRLASNGAAPYAMGIATQDQFMALVDRNEMFDWPSAAIYVNSEAPDSSVPPARPQNLKVVRNFLHHNLGFYGYGVFVGDSYPLIEGNTFLSHYHAIAASKARLSAYRAWFNLVLSAGVEGGSDFDAHGSGEDDFGGEAGQYFEIGRNSFLGSNRPNFNLRGEPALTAEFLRNVSRQSLEDAVECSYCGDKLNVYTNNHFSSPRPTNRLGVGDFDGDGTQDLFLATGEAWYYAPGGKAEWRYLNARTDGIADLLFGDFDADGRTDVFTQHGYSWDVSWGGASDWESINVSWSIRGAVAVGDFIGDERDDVFYADGERWYASDGGASSFTPLDVSRYLVPSLRFGDFDADGKTDVFGVVDGYWQVAFGGASGWTRLRPKLTDTVATLTVADFNGDGRADVATSNPWLTGHVWKMSSMGTADWTTLRTDSAPLFSAAAIGRFDGGNTSADVLLWNHNNLDIAGGAAGTAVRHSRQDMR
jgi:hypothetical protein